MNMGVKDYQSKNDNSKLPSSPGLLCFYIGSHGGR